MLKLNPNSVDSGRGTGKKDHESRLAGCDAENSADHADIDSHDPAEKSRGVEAKRGRVGISRRDFLRCRSSGGVRVVYLSCQRLFMRISDLRTEDRISGIQNEDAAPEYSDDEWWSEEPPALLASASTTRLWDDVSTQINEADILVLEEREWLQDRELASNLEPLLAAFRNRGGEMRFAVDRK